MRERHARDCNGKRLRPRGISHLAGILSSISSMGIYEGAEQRYEWGEIFQ